MARPITPRDTAAMLEIAEGIVKRFGAIADIVYKYENTEEYSSLSAIEAVAKITKGDPL